MRRREAEREGGGEKGSVNVCRGLVGRRREAEREGKGAFLCY